MPATARPTHSHSHACGQAGAKPKLDNQRHPERTPLYQTIAEHFETWFELASAGQFDGQGDHHTPKPYVRQAFRKYLETAAHLTDHVLPRLPVRQWVLSVPKRLRYFMQRNGAVLNMVLRIFLRVISQSLQSHCPGAAQVDRAALHIGAVAFIHRFGSSLKPNPHRRASSFTRPVLSMPSLWPRCRQICVDASCAPSWAGA